MVKVVLVYTVSLKSQNLPTMLSEDLLSLVLDAV